MMRFALEALQAHDGDCLLLHYERDGAAPTRILIDGGSAGIYTSVLKPRLMQLAGGQLLALRMAMVSHIDADHITGVLDLFKELHELQDDGVDPFCQIRTLWHNAFKEVQGNAPASIESGAVGASLDGHIVPGLDEFAQAVVASVPQGNELRNHATKLTIPINQSAGGPLVRAPEQGALNVNIADGLTFTVLAPHEAQLDRLQAAWTAAKAAHPANPAAQAADYLNNTVPNMSSIVVLAEAQTAPGSTKRMLLTGDARGDVILDALNTAGLMTDGKIHVDLLKVQHHGSSHSTTQDFFERVTADRYVISGNGKSDNPHPDALGWLSKARAGAPYEAFLTNRTGLNDLGTKLDAFLASETQHEPSHVYHFRPDQALSITVELTG
jgi:beta-lactamase superfamily II metal-dependent hydrolase